MAKTKENTQRQPMLLRIYCEARRGIDHPYGEDTVPVAIQLPGGNTLLIAADGVGSGKSKIDHSKALKGLEAGEVCMGEKDEIQALAFAKSLFADIMFDDCDPAIKQYASECFVSCPNESYYLIDAKDKSGVKERERLPRNERSTGFYASRVVVLGILNRFFKEFDSLRLEDGSRGQAAKDLCEGIEGFLKNELPDMLKKRGFTTEGLDAETARKYFLPTTLSIFVCKETEHRKVKGVGIWAGDSRLYTVDARLGIRAVSIDDESEATGNLNNFISMSDKNDFHLSYRDITVTAPCALFGVSDGGFDYKMAGIDPFVEHERLYLPFINAASPEALRRMLGFGTYYGVAKDFLGVAKNADGSESSPLDEHPAPGRTPTDDSATFAIALFEEEFGELRESLVKAEESKDKKPYFSRLYDLISKDILPTRIIGGNPAGDLVGGIRSAKLLDACKPIAAEYTEAFARAILNETQESLGQDAFVFRDVFGFEAGKVLAELVKNVSATCKGWNIDVTGEEPEDILRRWKDILLATVSYEASKMVFSPLRKNIPALFEKYGFVKEEFCSESALESYRAEGVAVDKISTQEFDEAFLKTAQSLYGKCCLDVLADSLVAYLGMEPLVERAPYMPIYLRDRNSFAVYALSEQGKKATAAVETCAMKVAEYRKKKQKLSYYELMHLAITVFEEHQSNANEYGKSGARLLKLLGDMLTACEEKKEEDAARKYTELQAAVDQMMKLEIHNTESDCE
ncbi:MAG: hypothetical protein IJF71_06625 [Clostridia bacterium]|nr:hypothetical protein [Clostridia bacterium]